MFIKYIDEKIEGVESTINLREIFPKIKMVPIYKLLDDYSEEYSKKITIPLVEYKVDIKQYEKVKYIDAGGYGEVFKVKKKGKIHDEKEQYFAAKILRINKVNEENFVKELKIQMDA